MTKLVLAVFFCEFVLAFAAPVVSCAGTIVERDVNAADYRRFTVPIELRGLLPRVEVPIGCEVDFQKLVRQIGTKGFIDERSIRLRRLVSRRPAEHVPIQFSPVEQPVLRESRLLAGTGRNVSFC